MATNDGGPAFPYSALQPDEKTRQLVGTIYADNQGMSLRDWFAGKAMQGILSNPTAMNVVEKELDILDQNPFIADLAYHIADAMLLQRKK